MKIPKDIIVDPARNTAYVVPAVALSLFVFAYSIRFGQISILAFYAVWFLPLVVAPRILLVRPWAVALLLIVPGVFAASTLWSDASATTLRAGIQYGTTVVCALIAARIVSVPNLALGGTIGGLLVLLYSAANGGYSFDYIDGSYAFNGAFSSKNQLGYYATLSILFASSLVWGFRSRPLLYPLAAAVTVLGIVMLLMSNSATSLLSAFAAFGAIALAGTLPRLAPGPRRAAVTLVLSGGVAMGLAAYRLGAFDAVLGAFGKDSTLTGRTYLWNQALTFGAEQPFLGIGYSAFWVRGRPEAETLWETFYITGRTGFHFHNLLIETYVGTGLLGLALVAALCVLLFVLPISATLGPAPDGSVMLCTGLSVLFLVRSVAEVDFVTPYTAGTFLVPFIILYLTDRSAVLGRAVRRARAVRTAGRLPEFAR